MRYTGIPKYLEVKNQLSEKIDDGVYPVGEMIPTENELMESFNVSRITIRRALAELEAEGYIYRLQGKGTFVKDEDRQQDLFILTSCTEDIKRMGMTPSRITVESKITDADRKTREHLKLNTGDEVLCLKRVYLADGEPINYTTSYLPLKLFPGLDKYDFGMQSLYEVLESHYDTKILKSIRTIEAVLAPEDVCELLDVENNVPLILFKSVVTGKVSGKELPIETFKCYYRSDKFSFAIQQMR
ncbi:MAG: GntR family transcriptional regulator [Parasporobacterium sp.]|nr:GntR family transcriptional regulator [Parasporobacterium sp.]